MKSLMSKQFTLHMASTLPPGAQPVNPNPVDDGNDAEQQDQEAGGGEEHEAGPAHPIDEGAPFEGDGDHDDDDFPEAPNQENNVPPHHQQPPLQGQFNNNQGNQHNAEPNQALGLEGRLVQMINAFQNPHAEPEPITAEEIQALYENLTANEAATFDYSTFTSTKHQALRKIGHVLTDDGVVANINAMWDFLPNVNAQKAQAMAAHGADIRTKCILVLQGLHRCLKLGKPPKVSELKMPLDVLPADRSAVDSVLTYLQKVVSKRAYREVYRVGLA